MSAAVDVMNVTKKFIKPGLSRREWRGRPTGSFKNGQFLTAGMEEITVFDRLSFQVDEGEIFGITGQHGSGKTTLIRLLAGLLKPDAGEIRLFGSYFGLHPIQVQPWINRVSVEASFFKRLSALENLTRVRESGFRGTEVQQKTIEILMRLGMDALSMHTPMENLTHSMLQKVSIARALLSRPRLLLLDDPTHDLDAESQVVFQQLLVELREETGATVLLSSQKMAEAESLFDRYIVLDSGIAVIRPSFAVDSLQNTDNILVLEPCI